MSLEPGTLLLKGQTAIVTGAAAGLGRAIATGFESLSRSLALELACRRIRVNCIAPDAIPTPGIGDARVPTPLPDPGHPDAVAAAAVFLASPASRFVTGATLPVDGGSRAAGGWRRDGDGFVL